MLPMRVPCSRCQDRGLIRVNYQSGEPFDIAICDCATGYAFREAGELVIRQKLRDLSSEHQIAYREHFDGESPARPDPHDRGQRDKFRMAARVLKGAKL